MASEAAAGVTDSVVTRLGQKNGQDLKSDGYRTWIVPKGRKAELEACLAAANAAMRALQPMSPTTELLNDVQAPVTPATETASPRPQEDDEDDENEFHGSR